VHTLDALRRDHSDARLVVVGGPSGPHGEGEVAALADLVDRLGLGDRVDFVAPQPHELLSTYYRAADVCLVPSRSESFGPGRPRGRGLRDTGGGLGCGRTAQPHRPRPDRLPGRGRRPETYAAWVRQILAEPLLAERLSTGAVLRARRYTWAQAAHLLREIYAELTVGRLVECS